MRSDEFHRLMGFFRVENNFHEIKSNDAINSLSSVVTDNGDRQRTNKNKTKNHDHIQENKKLLHKCIESIEFVGRSDRKRSQTNQVRRIFTIDLMHSLGALLLVVTFMTQAIASKVHHHQQQQHQRSEVCEPQILENLPPDPVSAISTFFLVRFLFSFVTVIFIASE